MSRSSVKFRYSEKATKSCEISIFDLIDVKDVKSIMGIWQNYVAFSQNLDFIHVNIIELTTYKGSAQFIFTGLLNYHAVFNMIDESQAHLVASCTRLLDIVIGQTA